MFGRPPVADTGPQPGDEEYPLGVSQAGDVATMRYDRLREAGYSVNVSGRWAQLHASELDLHTAEELAEAGCPLATAVRILEP